MSKLAAQRDAKAYRVPDRFNVMRWHAVAGGAAACNSRVVLDIANAQPAAGIHRDMRCTKNGCHELFRYWDSEQKHEQAQ